MTRNNGEQATRKDCVDWDTYRVPDDDGRHYPDQPSGPLPDHGAQPRTKRRRVDPFTDPEHLEPVLSEYDLLQIRVARVLKALALAHAQRLAWRRPDVLEAIIRSEVLPEAEWVMAGSVPKDRIPSVLSEFLDVLRDELKRYHK
jgi:hypothetical protein